MGGSDLHVLIIDDSPVDRMMLSAVLKKEGYQITTACNGTEGLLLARKIKPDIILLDVLMPGESGFDTCARLKRDVHTNPIPVIFLSSSDGLQSRVTGLTAGAVDYIIKPFEREEVLARIRIHIRIQRAFEALIEQQKAQLKQLQAAQRAILVQPHEIPAARFSVYYRPLHEAGGDFYDVIPQAESIFGYFTADIVGHDLGAAFITSALKVLLPQNFNALYTPVETMHQLNRVLQPVLSEGVMLSACCARLNRASNHLVIVSAGHPPLIHLKVNGEIDFLSSEGDLLGAFDSPTFESSEYRVSPGDRILFFSDGLIESNHGRAVPRPEGLRLLAAAADQHKALPLVDWVNQTAFAIFSAAETPEDDLLLLGVEV